MRKYISPERKYGFLVLIQLSVLSLSFIDILHIRPLFSFFYLTFIPGYLILQLQPLKGFDFFEKGILSALLSISFTMLFGLLLNFLLKTIGISRPLAAEVIIPSFIIVTLILTCLSYISEKLSQNVREDHISCEIRSQNISLPLIWAAVTGSGRELNSTRAYSHSGEGSGGDLPPLGKDYIGVTSESTECVTSKLLDLRFDRKIFNLVLFAIFLPLLSLLGVQYMNSFSYNTIIIFTLLLIILAVFLVSFDLIPARLYPIFILSIGLSLTLIWSLRSPHIIFGADNDWEYYLYDLTIINGLWQNYTSHTLDACLSISLLPAIYHSFLNINSVALIRFIYPILTSISPLIVYYISKRYLPQKFAFFAVFYFMSFYNFFTVNNRVNIALLFFAGTIYLLFLAEYGLSKKIPMLVFFISALTVSHYSTAFITLILITSTFILYLSLNFIAKIQKDPNALINYIRNPPVGRNKFIGINFIIVSSIIIFSWFAYVVTGPLHGAVHFIERTITKIPLFGGEGGGRSSVIQIAAGTNVYGGIIGQIELVLTYVILSIVCLGVVLTAVHYINSLKSNVKPSHFIHIGKFVMPKEFYLSCFLSICVLVALVVLPHASLSYDITRSYFQFSYMLSPFLAIGLFKIYSITGHLYTIIRNHMFNTPFKTTNEAVKAENCHRAVSYILVTILVMYFLCTLGLLYQIGGYDRTLILNDAGKEYDDIIITEYEDYGAKWVSTYTEYGDRTIYTDPLGRFRVIICGLIEPYLSVVNNKIPETDKLREKEYIFLRSYNIDQKKIGTSRSWVDYDEISLFEHSSTVYFNGGSKILAA